METKPTPAQMQMLRLAVEQGAVITGRVGGRSHLLRRDTAERLAASGYLIRTDNADGIECDIQIWNPTEKARQAVAANVKGHKCVGVAVGFSVRCECGWTSGVTFGKSGRASAYAEWHWHKDQQCRQNTGA